MELSDTLNILKENEHYKVILNVEKLNGSKKLAYIEEVIETVYKDAKKNKSLNHFTVELEGGKDSFESGLEELHDMVEDHKGKRKYLSNPSIFLKATSVLSGLTASSLIVREYVLKVQDEIECINYFCDDVNNLVLYTGIAITSIPVIFVAALAFTVTNFGVYNTISAPKRISNTPRAKKGKVYQAFEEAIDRENP